MPESLKHWDYDKNFPDTPQTVSKGSSAKRWWKCDRGHEWEQSPYSYKGHCILCRAEFGLKIYPKDGESLGETHPSLQVFWSAENMFGMKDITKNFSKKVVFCCPVCSHRWQEAPTFAYKRKNFCPGCASKMLSTEKPKPELSLSGLYPTLALLWDTKKNYPHVPSDIKSTSKKEVWWRCRKNHSFLSSPGKMVNAYKRNTSSEGCNTCKYELVAVPKPGKSFADVYPEKAKEWHPTKNGTITPFDINPGVSNKKFWWICELGHEQQTSPQIRGNGDCFLCAHLKRNLPKPGRSVAENYPQLVVDWHPTKNGDWTPENVGIASNKVIHWLCENGHETSCSAAARCAVGSCPRCRPTNTSFSEKAFHAYLSAWGKLSQMNAPGDSFAIDVDIKTRKYASVDIFGVYSDARGKDWRVVVEYDGSYYHSGDNFKASPARDKRKTLALLTQQDILLVRVREKHKTFQLPDVQVVDERLFQVSCEFTADKQVRDANIQKTVELITQWIDSAVA